MVRPEIEKLALTFCRNGENSEVSTPALPRHRSCVTDTLNPGSRSLSAVLVIDWVTQPVEPGSLACSKS